MDLTEGIALGVAGDVCRGVLGGHHGEGFIDDALEVDRLPATEAYSPPVQTSLYHYSTAT